MTTVRNFTSKTDNRGITGLNKKFSIVQSYFYIGRCIINTMIIQNRFL